MRRFKVQGTDVGDGLGDLLAIGSNVLDGGAADEAGDAGEAFQATDSLLTDVKDQGVPVCAGGNLENVASAFNMWGDGEVEDEAGVAFVGDEEVGASAEDEGGDVVFSGGGDCFPEVEFIRDAGEVAGGTSDAEGGVRGQGDVLFDLHWCQGT